MGVRIFLFVLAVAWTPYGLYCLFFPEMLAGVAGVEAMTATGATELRAMYGGVQAAIGLSALLGFFRVVYVDQVLFTQLVVISGLAVARSLAAVATADWSGYTLGALAFEWLTLVLCVVAMRSHAKAR